MGSYTPKHELNNQELVDWVLNRFKKDGRLIVLTIVDYPDTNSINTLVYERQRISSKNTVVKLPQSTFPYVGKYKILRGGNWSLKSDYYWINQFKHKYPVLSEHIREEYDPYRQMSFGKIITQLIVWDWRKDQINSHPTPFSANHISTTLL